MEAELRRDRLDPHVYRVEAIHEDGAVEVAIFIGPNALEHAILFASGHYSGWRDPEDLSCGGRKDARNAIELSRAGG